MSEKEKTELDEIIARCHITKDDLYMEAECVEEYGGVDACVSYGI